MFSLDEGIYQQQNGCLQQGFGFVTFYLADPDPPENATKCKL